MSMIVKYKYGSCEYSFESDYVHIYNLFVKKEHRRKGVARELLNKAILEIRDKGYLGEIYIVAKPVDDSISKLQLKCFYKSLGLKVYDDYL